MKTQRQLLEGHSWRSRDELISDVHLWTPTYGRAKAGRPARTYIQQLCEDTGCSPEDLPEAMNDREKWRERVRDIRASGTTWWWWWWWWLCNVHNQTENWEKKLFTYRVLCLIARLDESTRDFRKRIYIYIYICISSDPFGTCINICSTLSTSCFWQFLVPFVSFLFGKAAELCPLFLAEVASCIPEATSACRHIKNMVFRFFLDWNFLCRCGLYLAVWV